MSTYDLDSVARRFVEHDTLPMTTFGPLGAFGEAAVANDNRAAMGAGMSDVDPEGLFLAATRETQGGGYSFPRRRKGSYISTYTGRFFPMDPRASEVRLVDIAHQLAAIARFGGATSKRYCVAEHSVHIARWLLPRYGHSAAMHGLMHDAPEALSGFNDVQRPSKDNVPQIKAIENKIWLAVAAAFGLSPFIPECVHEADNRIIADEMAQGMWEGDPEYRDPLGVTLEFWNPERAEAEFLAEFAKLQNMRAAA